MKDINLVLSQILNEGREREPTIEQLKADNEKCWRQIKQFNELRKDGDYKDMRGNQIKQLKDRIESNNRKIASLNEGSAWDTQQKIKYLKQDIADIEDDLRRIQKFSGAQENNSEHKQGLEKRLAQHKVTLKKLMTESEQLDEISKKTLGSYIKKASDNSLKHKEWEQDQYHNDGEDMEHHTNKIQNRQKGINRAVNRLTKEAVQIDEAKKKKSLKRRNEHARSLENPKFRHKVIPNKKKNWKPYADLREMLNSNILENKLSEDITSSKPVDLSKFKPFMLTQTNQLIKNNDEIKKRIDNFFSFVNRFDWTKLQQKERNQIKMRLEETENFLHFFFEILDKTVVQLKGPFGSRFSITLHEDIITELDSSRQSKIAYYKQEIDKIKKSMESANDEKKKEFANLLIKYNTKLSSLNEAFALGHYKDYFHTQGVQLYKDQAKLSQALHDFTTFINNFPWERVDANAKEGLKEEMGYIEQLGFSIQSRIENMVEAIGEDIS